MNSNKHIWVLDGSIIVAAIAFSWGIKDLMNNSENNGFLLASAEQKSCCNGKTCTIPGMSSLTKLTGVSDIKGMLGGMCQKACGMNHYDEGDVVLPAVATVGDITKCPVSGAIFKVKETSPIVTVEGNDYYTCCSTCAGLLDQQPDLFELGD